MVMHAMRYRLAFLPLTLFWLLSFSRVMAQGQADAHQPNQSSSASNALAQQTIEFYPDSSSVDERFLPIIAAHAAYLVAHPAQKIIITGHFQSENSAREYDIALGEQLAKSVELTLLSAGVDLAQISVVSYGRERPRCLQPTPACQQQNAYVSILYR